jgi:hypothetical protein
MTLIPEMRRGGSVALVLSTALPSGPPPKVDMIRQG